MNDQEDFGKIASQGGDDGFPVGEFNREDGAQSSSIDFIRVRIASVQEKNLDLHVGEYETIHSELVRALSAIDGV